MCRNKTGKPIFFNVFQLVSANQVQVLPCILGVTYNIGMLASCFPTYMPKQNDKIMNFPIYFNMLIYVGNQGASGKLGCKSAIAKLFIC